MPINVVNNCVIYFMTKYVITLAIEVELTLDYTAVYINKLTLFWLLRSP